MSFVGKVLVVVQVVLSLCFMAFAGAVYSTQTNWRTKATQFETDLAKVRSEMTAAEDRMKQELAVLTKERNDQEQRAIGLQAEVDNVNQQLTARDTELATLKSDLAKQVALAQIAGTEAEMRLEEAQLQRDRNKVLHDEMDQMIVEKRQLEDKLFGEQIAREAYLKKHNNLLEDYAVLQKIIRANGLNDDPQQYVGREQPPPQVDAFVLNTREADRNGVDLVEISIGSDDGLATGHEVFVYRNHGQGKYLGKLKIVHVTPDRAVGTVIEKARNGVIQKGDNVTTKL